MVGGVIILIFVLLSLQSYADENVIYGCIRKKGMDSGQPETAPDELTERLGV